MGTQANPGTLAFRCLSHFVCAAVFVVLLLLNDVSMQVPTVFSRTIMRAWCPIYEVQNIHVKQLHDGVLALVTQLRVRVCPLALAAIREVALDVEATCTSSDCQPCALLIFCRLGAGYPPWHSSGCCASRSLHRTPFRVLTTPQPWPRIPTAISMLPGSPTA